MRLINTESLDFREFVNTVPKYAILSHRWQPDELGEATLQEYQGFLAARPKVWDEESTDDELPLARTSKLRSVVKKLLGCFHGSEEAQPLVKTTPGLRKVLDFCHIAEEHGYEWAWIDTVCIDKTNSTELSAAINSMYKWYQNSACCFVYLADFKAGTELHKLHHCDWFRRGWTLQEFLAPENVVFFDCDWKSFGTKKSLSYTLCNSMRIPQAVMENPHVIGQYSVAQRMSWAADRVTTRGEDVAYCMLGLFGIQMTPMYGEGAEEAFQRLQKQIMQEYDDESLLAWEWQDDWKDHGDRPVHEHTVTVGSGYTARGWRLVVMGTVTGIFARSPRAFKSCYNVRRSETLTPERPLRSSSCGIEVSRTVSVLLLDQDDPRDDCILMPLGCVGADATQASFIVLVRDESTERSANRWCRLAVPSCWMMNLDINSRKHGQARSETHLFICIDWPKKSEY